MSQRRPFVDPNSEELDYDWLVDELIPIAKLLLVFGVVGAFLSLLAASMRPGTVQQLIAYAAQFVFSLGGFVTLLYVIVRALQINEALEAGTVGRGTDPKAGSETVERTRIDVESGDRTDELGDGAQTEPTGDDDTDHEEELSDTEDRQ
ncbi:hypothetical protein OB955_17810 [Halobacteria archaeon AArc-m2/3/4]|uniref:Solute:sodium symporter small subunit n=1 Tax=Natronoglomus mannanivorans TaxID=2979990 RepID=A0ABT2QI33_9EURY|nr:hypothetical protein [Halobacteria archaeon AArc-m2/3/4]